MSVQKTCSDSACHHIFHDPFCENISTLKKIGIVVFHILTVMIPFLVYHAGRLVYHAIRGVIRSMSSCCKKSTYTVASSVTSVTTSIPSVAAPRGSVLLPQVPKNAKASLRPSNSPTRPVAPSMQLPSIKYRDLGESYLKTMECLKQNPLIKPRDLGSDVIPPRHPSLLILMSLLDKQNQNIDLSDTTKWNNEDQFTQDATLAMNIAYTISSYTLDELPIFEQSLKCGKEVLIQSDNYYFYHTFLKCSETYHYLRDPNNQLFSAELFYQDSPQGKWRELYNKFCEEIKKVVTISKMHAEYAIWLKPDLSLNTYATSVEPSVA